METCSVIQNARLVLLALLLIVFSALSAARSYTASIDTDHTAMTESYSPFSDLEEITALPTEFVSTASSSTRDTVTDWGNHASTEITDPLLGFSEEQQPPTEANSATEVIANTGVSTDTESWDSPALTDGTYTFSTISRAGERTLLSVTSNSTAPYTDNSSPYSENTSPYTDNSSPYSENTSPYTDNSSPYSDGTSPNSENTTLNSENSTQNSDNTSPNSESSSPYSENTSPYPENSSPNSDNTSPNSESTTQSSDNSTPNSDNTSPNSDNTSPNSESTTQNSDNSTPNSDNTSPNSDNTSPNSETSPDSDNTSPNSENSSYSEYTPKHTEGTSSYSENTSSFSENSTSYTEDSSQVSSQGHTQESQSESTVNGASTNRATSRGFDQSDTTSGSSSFHSPTDGSQSTHSETGSPSDISRQSTGTMPDSTPNSTPPLTVTDREGTDIGGTDRGSTDIGGTDRGSTDIGGTDRGSTDRAGTDTGGPDRVSTATLSGHTSQAGTYQSETGAPTSSEKPVHSTEDHVADTSGPGRESATTSVTESSTGPFGPPALDHTQDEQPHTQEDDPGQAFSMAPPEADDRTTVVYNPSTALPFTPETERPAETTEVLATTLTTTTGRTQFAEGDTFQATTGFFTTMPGSTTAPYRPSTSAEPSTTPTTTTTTATTTTPATATQTTPEPKASPSTTQHLPPSRTSGTAAHTSASDSLVSTDVSTLHLETSTATPGNGTSRRGYTTASYGSTAASRATPPHTSGNRTHGVTPPHTSGNHTHGVTPAQTTGKHTHGVTPAQTTGKHTQRASTTQTTTVQTRVMATVTPESPCSWNPCRNGGTCVPETGEGHGCVCLPSWTGPDCDEDMDECVSGPCPLGSQCVNTRGSFSCVCPLGSDLEHGRACTRARTFLGTFHLSNVPPNSTHPRSLVLHELQREILQLLNASLSTLKGYSRSTLNKSDGSGMQISAVHTFAMSAEVTSDVVTKSIETFLESCSRAVGPCRVALHHALLYRAESLCAAMGTQCDLERTNCTDTDGTTSCQCRAGYFKHSTEDLTCRECEEGFKLENGTCVRCMFGFGGFNCGNFYKLITVVVAPAGGVILLILIIALIVTCCKKDKNDISKIIFKSGDFQMSPYAEYPKNNRVSMEWGRETIEMQENGSTKNLLQMTDIYYSPALRNPELERSGLYPFSGMPGSRHSCIYPAQWNPSFISDDTRRRDYF